MIDQLNEVQCNVVDAEHASDAVNDSSDDEIEFITSSKLHDEEVSLSNANNTKFNIALEWIDLCYTIDESNFLRNFGKLNFLQAFKKVNKVILQRQSGSINNGCLMAVMGKSGCGKSTLIESLTNRRSKGLTGEVVLRIDPNVVFFIDEKRIKMSFVPQSDNLLETLTVRESIQFASKLKNNDFDRVKHKEITTKLIKELDLEKCKNVRVSNCSGGQKKRLTIAMELVSKPTILVLDEPTSGLDSSSALQCVQLLKQLTQSKTNPLSVLLTIHQPSAKILSEFHKLYLLSYNGQCLYNGPVDKLLAYFKKFDVRCPIYHNPGDHAMEVSSGEYGDEVINQMADYQRSINTKDSSREDFEESKLQVSSIVKSMTIHTSRSSASHVFVLLQRTLLTTVRDPVLNFFRFFLHVFVGLLLISIYKEDIGNENGCLNEKGGANGSKVFSIDEMRNVQTIVTQNIGFLFFSILFLEIGGIVTTVLVFSMEMLVFLRERTNGWYSCLSFYVAKTLADIPFQVLCTILFSSLTYYFSGQPRVCWRFITYLTTSILTAIFGQSIGLIFGAIFSSNASTALLMSITTIVPTVLFSGFFIKLELIPYYMAPFTYLSIMRYSLESFILTLYGFNRCAINDNNRTNETMTSIVIRFFNFLSRLELTYSNTKPLLRALAIDRNLSLNEMAEFDRHFEHFNASNLNFFIVEEDVSVAVSEFSLKDHFLYNDIIMLIVLLTALRVLTYFVFVLKANRRK